MGNGKKRKSDSQKQNNTKLKKNQKTPTKVARKGRKNLNCKSGNENVENVNSCEQVEQIQDIVNLTTNDTELVMVVIDEGDDGKVTMEVDGMYLDFQSDFNETESDSDKEEEVLIQERNVSRGSTQKERRRSYSSHQESGECDSEEDDVNLNQ